MSLPPKQPDTRGSNQFSEIYTETKNYLVCQQSIFIAILNQYCHMNLSKPTKRSNITEQFIKIQSIQYGSNSENDVDFSGLIEQRVKERLEFDIQLGITEVTAKRRVTSNKIHESLHYLIDMLSILDYQFHITTIGGKNNSMKIDTVHAIFFKNKLLFDEKQIKENGEKINHYLCSEIGDKKEYDLEMNNKTLLSYIPDLNKL